MGAAHKLEIKRHNERMSAAWHSGMIARSAKPPKLRDMLARDPEEKAQTAQDMFAVMQQWDSALNRAKAH